jgi:photosystem II stability/assembly factor-like uncharacterized protein
LRTFHKANHLLAWPRIVLIGCIAFLALCSPEIVNAQGTDPVPPIPLPGAVFKSTDSGATWVTSDTGVSAGAVYALVADPVSPGVIYLGTNQGVFRTRDGGAHWVQSVGAIALFSIDTVAVDPVNPLTVYAGGFSNSSVVSGIFKSEDGGRNWKPIYSGSAAAQISYLVIAPENHNVLYAIDDRQLLKSTDGGNQWVAALSYPPTDDMDFFAEFALDSGTSTTIYVTGNSHFYRSTNSGNSWTDLTDRLAQGSGAELFGGCKADLTLPSTVYVGTFSKGVAKTTDGGDTWEIITDEDSVRRYSVVAAAPPVLYSTYPGVTKSTDQGTTWVPVDVSASLPPVDHWAIDAASSSTLYTSAILFSQAPDKPVIAGFSFDGKKLIVSGGNFDDGAVILLDGVEQGTKNDPQAPESSLIGKKAGKKVRNHPETLIQVRNANGKLSQKVTIWPPLN